MTSTHSNVFYFMHILHPITIMPRKISEDVVKLVKKTKVSTNNWAIYRKRFLNNLNSLVNYFLYNINYFINYIAIL